MLFFSGEIKQSMSDGERRRKGAMGMDKQPIPERKAKEVL
jgi:hypothetical protein